MTKSILLLLVLLTACADLDTSTDTVAFHPGHAEELKPRDTLRSGEELATELEQVELDGEEAPPAICACETAECASDWIRDNMSCGICATFLCGDHQVGACVLCE